MLVALLLILAWLPTAAMADVRVYINSVPYRGTARLEGPTVWVRADELARDVGWQVHQEGQAVCLSPPGGTCPPGAGPGFYLNGQKFDRARQEGDAWWMSLLDAATALHGRGQVSGDVAQCQVSSFHMTQDPTLALRAQLQLAPRTLVLFYIEADGYSKHYMPTVRQFAARHAGQVRLVEVDLLKPGSNWIFVSPFKTPSNGIPELALVNRQGQVLQKLLGDTDVTTLEKELDGYLK